SHFAGTLLVSDIATQPTEISEFRQREAFATRAPQRLLPHLAFQNHRVAVEQMFLCPLHGLSHGHTFLFGWTLRGLIAETTHFLTLASRQLGFPQGEQFIPAQIP